MNSHKKVLLTLVSGFVLASWLWAQQGPVTAPRGAQLRPGLTQSLWGVVLTPNGLRVGEIIIGSGLELIDLNGNPTLRSIAVPGPSRPVSTVLVVSSLPLTVPAPPERLGAVYVAGIRYSKDVDYTVTAGPGQTSTISFALRPPGTEPVVNDVVVVEVWP